MIAPGDRGKRLRLSTAWKSPQRFERENMEDYLAVLRNEFEAGDDSFLIQIRIDLVWKKDTFTRLVMAMHRCCEEHANSDVLERWMASGFYYLSTFVRDWTTHPSFPQTHELPTKTRIND